MRRISAILFLSLFALNGAGFYVYYAVQLRQVKLAMREELKQTPEHRLSLLKLSPEQFEQARVEEQELKINGKMFDIAYVTETNGVLFVYGMFDEKEDNLLAMISDLVCKPIKDNGSVPSEILSFIGLMYVVPGQNVDTHNSGKFICHFSDYSFSASSCFLEILPPPPWHS